jgi:acetyl esterase
MPGAWRWRWLGSVADDRAMNSAIDPELVPWLDMLPSLTFSDHSSLIVARATVAQLSQFRSAYEPAHPVEIRCTTAPGSPGAPAVPLRVYLPAHRDSTVPGLLYIHGGGFVMNDLELLHTTILRTVDELGVVVVAVDYRLAPEHPFPAPLEDCYAALTWMAASASKLSIDPARVGVAGVSAGGGLAAAVALLARDRGGPRLCFQLLNIPELDDRMDTPSMLAHHEAPHWDHLSVIFGWRSYLGAEPGSADVSPYAAPARAGNLSGLPPAFVIVCQLDPLRDEGIAYAQKLMHAGVPTELHSYPGTFHSSTTIESAAVSRRMRADEISALRRGLNVTARHGPTA